VIRLWALIFLGNLTFDLARHRMRCLRKTKFTTAL